MNLTLKQAEKLIKLAREAISAYFTDKEAKVSKDIEKEFGQNQGVFTSLYVNEELVGCIGFPEPVAPLYKAVTQTACSAAFEDPRFPPIKKEDMKNLRIEISILTKPVPIEVKKDHLEYIKKIRLGTDGLMIKDEFGTGLLLPQVPGEWDWNEEEFLSQTCKKAGLSPDCWRNLKKNVYKFQAQIFTEKNGKVIEKKS